MITVPTHKRHESPFTHSKTIDVFTSGPLRVTVQIHSRKKLLKGFKSPLQNRRQYRTQWRRHAILLQDLMKRDVCSVGWRCSKAAT